MVESIQLDSIGGDKFGLLEIFVRCADGTVHQCHT